MGENDTLDEWAAWLLHQRDGDDPEQRQKDLELLLPLRQRVLDNAQIVPGEIVLDVGAGDGLIAFGRWTGLGWRAASSCPMCRMTSSRTRGPWRPNWCRGPDVVRPGGGGGPVRDRRCVR